MYEIKQRIKTLLALLLFFTANIAAQTGEYELFTLFTTQQERELIDKNRYKTEQLNDDVVVTETAGEETPVVETKETITLNLAGVSISQSGQNVAWLNGQAFENGASMDDGSMVFINPESRTLVQVKTPDGKFHAVTTGETIDVVYIKP